MRIFFCHDVWLKFAAIILVCCEAGQAQGAATEFSESEIKRAVEESAVLTICPDQALLEFLDIEVGSCRSHISTFAPVCWHLIDKLVSDYEIESGEAGKERFISILSVYSSCIRSELVREIAKSSRESRAP